ncbi:bifunctional diaminohydroxyphosphoribosylaminopyrimidine deaminase/5-amino-6-(5-phosphoribosylamino)uracil reductase RibD [Chloroflexota bacterium]
MDYMEQALSLAKLAMGQTSPNPAVGAVVVNGDAIVGQGYTQPAGSHHAEVMALNQAGERAKGGVLYVTLEPCCHYGRTPPCTRQILDAGITEVHLATLDVNPLVSGQGKKELESRGVGVYVGEHEEQAREVVEAYARFITTGMPFVTVKFAASLDGKIATRAGESRWISGEESRKRVHNLRYTSDAIMTGVNTILADDPQLTAQCWGDRGGTARKQPLRVIVDSRGRTPLSSRIFGVPGKTLIALGQQAAPQEAAAFTAVGAEVVELPSPDGRVDLEKLLKALGERQITSVLMEAGGTLFGSLFDSRLVDKVVAFIAPVIIGGAEARTAVEGRGVDNLLESFRLRRVQVDRLGDDLMVSGYITE